MKSCSGRRRPRLAGEGGVARLVLRLIVASGDLKTAGFATPAGWRLLQEEDRKRAPAPVKTAAKLAAMRLSNRLKYELEFVLEFELGF